MKQCIKDHKEKELIKGLQKVINSEWVLRGERMPNIWRVILLNHTAQVQLQIREENISKPSKSVLSAAFYFNQLIVLHLPTVKKKIKKFLIVIFPTPGSMGNVQWKYRLYFLLLAGSSFHWSGSVGGQLGKNKLQLCWLECSAAADFLQWRLVQRDLSAQCMWRSNVVVSCAGKAKHANTTV